MTIVKMLFLISDVIVAMKLENVHAIEDQRVLYIMTQ